MVQFNPSNPTNPGDLPSTGSVAPPVTSSFLSAQDQVINAESINYDLSIYSSGQAIPLTPPDSLLKYVSFLSDSSLQFKDLLNRLEVHNYELSKKLAGFRSEYATDLIFFSDEIGNVGSQQDPLQAQFDSVIGPQNTLIAAYNAEVNKVPGGEIDQLNKLNQAITAYNNGTIDITTYLAAVKVYNDYINGDPLVPGAIGRNAQINAFIATIAPYNANITSLNRDLEIINTQRVNLGLPPLSGGSTITTVPSTLDQGPISSAIPVPLMPVDRVTIPSLPSVNVPSSEQTTSQFVDPIQDAVGVGLEQLRVRYRNNKADLNVRYFLQKGEIASQPDAYLEKIPAPFISSSINSGSSNQLGTIGALSSVTLERSLSYAVFVEATNIAELPLTAKTYKQLSAFALQLLNDLALTSVIPATSLFLNGTNSVAGNSQLAQLSFALTLLLNTNALASSNAAFIAIRNLIRNELIERDISEGEIAKLARELAAAVNLSLTGFAVTNLATNLNLPGLLPQLLANTPEINESELATATIPNVTTSDILGNALERIEIKAELSNRIVEQGIDNKDLADLIANRALDKIGLNAIQEEEEFRKALLEQLQQEGIDQLKSNAIAESIAKFVQQKADDPTNQPGTNISENQNLLQTPGLPSPLSPSALAEQLTTSIVAVLTPGLGLSTAQFIANDITFALLGSSSRERREADLQNPNSVVNVIKDNMNILANIENSKVEAKAFGMFRDFIFLQPQVYALLDAINENTGVQIDAIQGGMSLPSYSPTSYIGA